MYLELYFEYRTWSIYTQRDVDMERICALEKTDGWVVFLVVMSNHIGNASGSVWVS